MLVRTEGKQEDKSIYQIGHRCILGRHAECDIFDIFAGNSRVSRFHALLEFVGGRYLVEDKGSRNGTYLNGKPIEERTPLRSGDRLDIAGVEFTFLHDADTAPAAAAPSTDLTRISFAEPADSPVPLSSLSAERAETNGSSIGYSAEKLRALVQMLKCLGRSLDIDVTLQELLTGLLAIFPQAQSGFVAFTVEGQVDVIPRATYFRKNEENQRIGLSRTLLRHVLSRREAILWANQPGDQVSYTTLADLQIRSLMCAPLLDGDGKPFGIVQIDTDKAHNPFNSEDLEVMLGAVSQASVAVRFAKLHEDALHRQAMERDLELARQVQLGLLPEGYPDCEGFEFFAFYQAAHEVGGDFYDFVELPNDRLALVVADAAGKGVSAALMVAKLSGELKYHLSCQSPGLALARLNDDLCAGGTGRFVTLLVAILDRRSLTLTLVNAGHPVPLLRRKDGTVQTMAGSSRGVALGLIPKRQYQELTIAIEPGDLWCAYTDGFTEATNAKGEMFGADRLCQELTSAPAVVREAGDRLIRSVQSFQGGQQQSDDMCLIAWSLLGRTVESTSDFRVLASDESTKESALPRRNAS
jgi:serine phosphatase RsbU (regulator of sigma subunit)